MTTVISIIAFILIIGLVIFIHEFGHFLLAKKNGVGVVELAIGMGPKIFSWVKNGTQYSLRLVPFGGYCMLLGAEMYLPNMEGEEEQVVVDEEHAYSNKHVLTRIAVTIAGPVFNSLLALLLAFLLVALVGVNTTKVGYVSPDYPAETAGLQAGDEIVKLNGTRVHIFSDISLYLAVHEGENVLVTYEREGEHYETEMVPVYNEEAGRYLIGITSDARQENLNVGEVVKYGWYTFTYNTGAVVKSLGMLVTGRASFNDLSGPVGMAGMVNDIVTDVEEDTKEESSWVTAFYLLVNLLNFTVLISANLAVMNLLPIPGMDGGKLLFLLIELVAGKPVPKKYEGIVTLVGFILLFLLMIAVLFNDVRKLIVGI